jgi:hypothetical protein
MMQYGEVAHTRLSHMTCMRCGKRQIFHYLILKIQYYVVVPLVHTSSTSQRTSKWNFVLRNDGQNSKATAMLTTIGTG